MRIYDWIFGAFATLPSILAFVVSASVDKPEQMLVAFGGAGLGVLLLPMGLRLFRGARGFRRIWLTVWMLIALVPFTLLAVAIGIQWLFYLILKLFGG